MNHNFMLYSPNYLPANVIVPCVVPQESSESANTTIEDEDVRGTENKTNPKCLSLFFLSLLHERPEPHSILCVTPCPVSVHVSCLTRCFSNLCVRSAFSSKLVVVKCWDHIRL